MLPIDFVPWNSISSPDRSTNPDIFLLSLPLSLYRSSVVPIYITQETQTLSRSHQQIPKGLLPIEFLLHLSYALLPLTLLSTMASSFSVNLRSLHWVWLKWFSISHLKEFAFTHFPKSPTDSFPSCWSPDLPDYSLPAHLYFLPCFLLILGSSGIWKHQEATLLVPSPGEDVEDRSSDSSGEEC